MSQEAFELRSAWSFPIIERGKEYRLTAKLYRSKLVIITNSPKFHNYFLDGDINLLGVVLSNLIEDGNFITFAAINYPNFSNFFAINYCHVYMDVVYFADVINKKLNVVEKAA